MDSDFKINPSNILKESSAAKSSARNRSSDRYNSFHNHINHHNEIGIPGSEMKNPLFESEAEDDHKDHHDM